METKHRFPVQISDSQKQQNGSRIWNYWTQYGFVEVFLKVYRIHIVIISTVLGFLYLKERFFLSINPIAYAGGGGGGRARAAVGKPITVIGKQPTLAS